MNRLRAAAMLGLCAAGLHACSRQDAAPTEVENGQMDAASNLLDAAPNELDRVDERLPGSNETGPPAEASDP